jgi:hypothetical protein
MALYSALGAPGMGRTTNLYRRQHVVADREQTILALLERLMGLDLASANFSCTEQLIAIEDLLILAKSALTGH